jgi:hypothetical protein
MARMKGKATAKPRPVGLESNTRMRHIGHTTLWGPGERCTDPRQKVSGLLLQTCFAIEVTVQARGLVFHPPATCNTFDTLRGG